IQVGLREGVEAEEEWNLADIGEAGDITIIDAGGAPRRRILAFMVHARGSGLPTRRRRSAVTAGRRLPTRRRSNCRQPGAIARGFGTASLHAAGRRRRTPAIHIGINAVGSLIAVRRVAAVASRRRAGAQQ